MSVLLVAESIQGHAGSAEFAELPGGCSTATKLEQ